MRRAISARECKSLLEYLLKIFEDENSVSKKELSELSYHDGLYGGRKYFSSYAVGKLLNLNTNNYQITKTKLNKMLKFIDEAIKQGFYGYVAFEEGYGNGMWVYSRINPNDNRKPTEGVALYHSFESDSNYWQVVLNVKTNQRTEMLNRNEMRKYLKENHVGGE